MIRWLGVPIDANGDAPDPAFAKMRIPSKGESYPAQRIGFIYFTAILPVFKYTSIMNRMTGRKRAYPKGYRYGIFIPGDMNRMKILEVEA
jgi:hypothetical protein